MEKKERRKNNRGFYRMFKDFIKKHKVSVAFWAFKFCRWAAETFKDNDWFN